jgi:multiple sugar transport system permease protein
MGRSVVARRVIRGVKRTLLYLAALAFTLFAIFPFYWMLLTTFKENRDLYVGGTVLTHVPLKFNAPPTMEHLNLLLHQTLYLTWVQNTVFIGVAVVIITITLAVPAGYALARLTGRWGERLGIAVFLTYLVPPTLLFIPFSRVISILGLQNTHWALILVYPTFTVPFCTWLMMGFFRSIPKDLEEQAMIDGYSRASVIRKIVLPLGISGILTATIFAFTLVLQDFVYALTFISSVPRMTVSLGVPVALVRGDVFYWGSLMAACLITSIPIAIVYNMFIDRFIAGLTAGAVKG